MSLNIMLNLLYTSKNLRNKSFNMLKLIIENIIDSKLFKNQKWLVVRQSKGGDY